MTKVWDYGKILEFMAKVGIAHHKKAQYDTMKQRKTQKIPKYFSIFFFLF